VKILPKSDLGWHVTIGHESRKDITAGEDVHTDGRAGLAPMRPEEGERNDRRKRQEILDRQRDYKFFKHVKMRFVRNRTR
jgi:hypothetical protein